MVVVVVHQCCSLRWQQRRRRARALDAGLRAAHPRARHSERGTSVEGDCLRDAVRLSPGVGDHVGGEAGGVRKMSIRKNPPVVFHSSSSAGLSRTVIQRIPRHFGLATETLEPCPARAPPIPLAAPHLRGDDDLAAFDPWS